MALKKKAKELGISQSELIRDAIETYLSLLEEEDQ